MNNKLLSILSLLGILILLLLSMLLPPKEITSRTLQNSSGNVKIYGKITSEKDYDNFKILTLKDNFGSISATCFSCPKLINRSVTIEGKIEEYQNKKQVQIEKITSAQILS